MARRHRGVAQPGAQGDDQLLGAGDPQHHAGALPVEGASARSVAGVGQGHAGRYQAQELAGVGRLQNRWRNPEFGGVEIHRVDESAAPAVHMVLPPGIRIDRSNPWRTSASAAPGQWHPGRATRVANRP